MLNQPFFPPANQISCTCIHVMLKPPHKTVHRSSHPVTCCREQTVALAQRKKNASRNPKETTGGSCEGIRCSFHSHTKHSFAFKWILNERHFKWNFKRSQPSNVYSQLQNYWHPSTTTKKIFEGKPLS